jgi:hypothetical protein
MTEPAASASTVPGTAPSERKWGKLLLALVAFFVMPSILWLRAFLPIENSVLLFVPALAACCLVGWWAGGRVLLAIIWVGLAAWLAIAGASPNDAFTNMARGWCLLLAGAFGLVCLFGTTGAFFPRALTALGLALGLSLMMSLVGPMRASEARKALNAELTRRNSDTMAELNGFISQHPKIWQQLTAKVPPMASMPAETEKLLKVLSTYGLELFPALLALESLAALALAWTTYHRLGRARLGLALGALRDFRFSDQLSWGVIVGLTVTFLPTLASVSGLGKNLLLFFCALYAVRGLGVLSWFFAPSVLALTLAGVFVMLVWPVNAFRLLAAAMSGVGLVDTWADLRRPRTTT